MTRYEAAALLNACLDRVTEVTDELKRLLKEFETGLAILKGRVDGLEARVGELEAAVLHHHQAERCNQLGFRCANFTDDQGAGLRPVMPKPKTSSAQTSTATSTVAAPASATTLR